jgi:hypothetical protein
MNIKLLILMAAVGMLVAAAADAQENTATTSDPNEIFNSIMQTMPKEMKALVDSASTTQRSQKGSKNESSSSVESKKDPQANIDLRQSSIDRLPENVREQVRKTMQELEKEKMERILEFKDSKNQKNVK